MISARPSTRKMMWPPPRKRHFGLMQDLARDVLLVVDDDTAGVDQLEAAAVVFGRPMDPVARDPGLVADDGAPLSCDAIEEGGLSDVGPAHNDHCGSGVRHALIIAAC